MKLLIAFCICGLSIAMFAQTRQHTFIDRDGVFQFKYSAVMIHCTPERITHGLDACNSQGGICSDPGNNARAVACFAHSKGEFKAKPTFVAAAFFVAEVDEAATEKACLAGSKDWNTGRVESTTINGVAFKVFEVSDNWAGGGQMGNVYRAFHNQKCYELGTQLASTNPGAYDPGAIETFTKEDRDEVQGRLTLSLHSFRFIK